MPKHSNEAEKPHWRKWCNEIKKVEKFKELNSHKTTAKHHTFVLNGHSRKTIAMCI